MTRYRAIAAVIAISLPLQAASQDSEIPLITQGQIDACDQMAGFMRSMMEYRLDGGDRASAEAQFAGNQDALYIVRDAFEIPFVDLTDNPGALEVGKRLAEDRVFASCIGIIAQ